MADHLLSVKTTTTGNLSKKSLSKISKTPSSQQQVTTTSKIGSKSINVKQFALLSLPHKVDLENRDDHHNQKLLKHFFPKQQEKIGSTIKAPLLKKSKILSGGSLFDVRKFSKVSAEKPKMANAAQKFKNVMTDGEKSKTTTTPLSVVGKKTTTTLSRAISPIPKSPELDSNLLLNEPDVIISKSFQFSSVKSFDHRQGSRKLAALAAPLAAGVDSSRKDGDSKIKKKPAPPFFSLLYWRQIAECLRNQSLVAWLTIAVLSVVVCLVIFYVAAAISAFRAPEPPPPSDYY